MIKGRLLVYSTEIVSKNSPQVANSVGIQFVTPLTVVNRMAGRVSCIFLPQSPLQWCSCSGSQTHVDNT